MKNALLFLFESCLSKRYTEVENGGSFAYERNGDALMIWFQHSHGAVDWLNNVSFAAVPYKEMIPQWSCHAGFLKVWNSIKPHLVSVIADPRVRRVSVVGYSHGAALALFCHEYIGFHRPDLRDTLCSYAYGCPRVLYGCVPPSVAMRWKHFYRVVNAGDLVTHLPPASLGYCHVGQLVELGEDGKYSAIDAHRPESYLAELEALPLDR